LTVVPEVQHEAAQGCEGVLCVGVTAGGAAK
jgi:hypothetical protein